MALSALTRFLRNCCSVKLNSLLETRNCDIRCIRQLGGSKVMVSLDPEKAYLTTLDDNATFSLSVFIEYDDLKFARRMIIQRPLTDTLKLVLHKFDSKLISSLEKWAHRKKLSFIKDFEIPNTVLIHDGKELPEDMISSKVFQLDGEINLCTCNKMYQVAINVPTVIAIRLPHFVAPHVELFPTEFKMLNALKSKTVFTWYKCSECILQTRAVDPWTKIGEGFSYLVTDDDVGSYIKLCVIPANEKSVGPEYLIVTENPVFEVKENPYLIMRCKYTAERPNDDEMRIVNYNILSDTYVNTKEGKLMFNYCPGFALKCEYRLHLLILELNGYNADLICLQEVDGKIYTNFLNTIFEIRGFEGEFCPKSTNIEGTAVFFNKKKFSWLYASNYRYSDEIVRNPELKNILECIKNESYVFDKITTLPHCFQLVVLDCLAKENEVVIIVNLHLYSAPHAWKVRLLQVYIAMAVAYDSKKIIHKNVSLIICGDLNSTPDAEIFDFVTMGKCTKTIEGTEPDEAPKWMKHLKHSYKMKSVFGTEEYTNYTPMFKGCIDYIFYESVRMEVSNCFPLPSKEDLEKYEGLPSTHHPSDHVALVADLKWKH